MAEEQEETFEARVERKLNEREKALDMLRDFRLVIDSGARKSTLHWNLDKIIIQVATGAVERRPPLSPKGRALNHERNNYHGWVGDKRARLLLRWANR